MRFLFYCHTDILFYNRQPSSAHAIPIHDDNTLHDIDLAQDMQDFTQASDYVYLAPIAIPKQNEARLSGSSERKQSRIVEISGHDCPPLVSGARHNLCVWGALEPQLDSMDGVMPLLPKPCRQGRRKRHVN
jgi:hypothetical protein